ncbi:hypothetical protein HYH03_010385 [Edaphochlamys debaryana]|nr:hypothetical protein HYH03_010385 [Edaphochlamys debaryana]|eukprot:KAG2491173.1 hypothetical protein HYH03_010385 [Edaphochlamys debaryana]
MHAKTAAIHTQPGEPAAAAVAAAPYGPAYGLRGGGFGLGGPSMIPATSTFSRLGSTLAWGAYPGLDPMSVRTIRRDLVNTAAAISGSIGYEDIVAEAGAADEYRAQLARVRARLASARAGMPSVLPSQDREVYLSRPIRRPAGPGSGPGAAAGTPSPLLAAAAAEVTAAAAAAELRAAAAGVGSQGGAGRLSSTGAGAGAGLGLGLGGKLGSTGAGLGLRSAAPPPKISIVGYGSTAPGSYRYTTLEDTRRLIESTRPYTAVPVRAG